MTEAMTTTRVIGYGEGTESSVLVLTAWQGFDWWGWREHPAVLDALRGVFDPPDQQPSEMELWDIAVFSGDVSHLLAGGEALRAIIRVTIEKE